MYHKKQELATLLYEGLDDLLLGDDEKAVSIDKLINANQKYHLIMSIINMLPSTNMEMVKQFNDTFQVDKETTHVVTDFRHGELRFRLLLEEVLELGAALGITSGVIYTIYIELQEKISKKNIEPSLEEVLDALTDITYVNEGALDVFNLSEISWEAMENVHDSNMSKLIPIGISKTGYEAIVADFKERGIPIRAIKREDGSIIIRHAETDKVMKPYTYRQATLGNLLNKFLNNE